MKKALYVSDGIINYELIDLILDKEILTQLSIVMVNKNENSSRYRDVDIYQDSDYFYNHIIDSELVILDLSDVRKGKEIEELLKQKHSIIMKIPKSIKKSARKRVLKPAILISGYASPMSQFRFCLGVKEAIEKQGAYVQIISDYVGAEVFDAVSILNLIDSINSDDVKVINNFICNELFNTESDLIIINVECKDELFSGELNLHKDVVVQEIIKSLNIDYFICIMPCSLCGENNYINNAMIRRFGIAPDYSLFSNEIITNASVIADDEKNALQYVIIDTFNYGSRFTKEFEMNENELILDVVNKIKEKMWIDDAFERIL